MENWKLGNREMQKNWPSRVRVNQDSRGGGLGCTEGSLKMSCDEYKVSPVSPGVYVVPSAFAVQVHEQRRWREVLNQF